MEWGLLEAFSWDSDNRIPSFMLMATSYDLCQLRRNLFVWSSSGLVCCDGGATLLLAYGCKFLFLFHPVAEWVCCPGPGADQRMSQTCYTPPRQVDRQIEILKITVNLFESCL